MRKSWKMALSLCAVAVTLATGSANADVLLYQNYTPGTTDYDTSKWEQINNTVPVYVYEFFSPGQARELSFTFTATASVIPRHVFLPIQINSYNAANFATVIVDIAEVNGDGRNWHAAGDPAIIGPTPDELDDKKIYFSFTEGFTPATRIGYEYEVTLRAAYADTQAYLSNVASVSSNYYTALTNFTESYNIVNESLDTEAAVSIHGDLVSVPEPASLMLLASSVLAMTCRRQRG